MSNVEKLKKKAAEFEQKKQFDKALEVYLQIIGQTEGQEDRDVTVYNRVGDLYLRLNKTDQAVNYYEQAVDLYTEGGYLNNAIALCNKILRHAPARHQIYYKLGKISAKKGFNSDAKKNFLEYADRMHRAGKDGDAFKALQEFADLCPGQDDIRLMLADQLAKAGKNAEAIEPPPAESIPALEIESTSLAGLEPAPSGIDIEPAFDLSINDIDVSPLEGLESAADQSQFAIDPELAIANASGVEGLISETTSE